MPELAQGAAAVEAPQFGNRGTTGATAIRRETTVQISAVAGGITVRRLIERVVGAGERRIDVGVLEEQPVQARRNA